MRIVALGVVFSCVLTFLSGVASAQGPPAPSAAEQKPKPTDWPELRRQREAILKDMAELEREIPELRAREGQLSVQELNLRNLEDEIRKARAQNRSADAQRLESLVKELSAKVAELRGEADKRKAAELTLRQKREELNKLDGKIGTLLTPELLFQDFKTWMSMVFAGLVLVVMLGFFVIAWQDETVRRAIFAGTAGIQFVTLFSLVIAIILFGITGILEGKELAALLGGLSGYILGRGTAGAGAGGGGGARGGAGGSPGGGTPGGQQPAGGGAP